MNNSIFSISPEKQALPQSECNCKNIRMHSKSCTVAPWHDSKLLFIILLTILSTFNFQLSTYSQTAPFPTDHLQLWLRADSVELTDGKVSRWYDLSPNNYVIQQTDESARPSINVNALNNKPALIFNGTSTFLTGGDILDLGNVGWTWFVVGQYNNGNQTGVNSPIFLGKYDRYNGWATQPLWTLGNEIWIVFWKGSQQVVINFS